MKKINKDENFNNSTDSLFNELNNIGNFSKNDLNFKAKRSFHDKKNNESFKKVSEESNSSKKKNSRSFDENLLMNLDLNNIKRESLNILKDLKKRMSNISNFEENNKNQFNNIEELKNHIVKLSRKNKLLKRKMKN